MNKFLIDEYKSQIEFYKLQYNKLQTPGAPGTMFQDPMQIPDNSYSNV